MKMKILSLALLFPVIFFTCNITALAYDHNGDTAVQPTAIEANVGAVQQTGTGDETGTQQNQPTDTGPATSGQQQPGEDNSKDNSIPEEGTSKTSVPENTGNIEEPMGSSKYGDGNNEIYDSGSAANTPSKNSFGQKSAALQPGTISVDKTAAPTTGERTYELRLDVNGTPPVRPVDVVIVIDSSGSMGLGGSPTPMDQAKSAAINFAKSIIDGNPNSRVGVVEFYDTSSIKKFERINGHRQTLTHNLSLVTSAINDIRAGGGTNTQSGFLSAGDVLNDVNNVSNPGAVKGVVLLSDGVANEMNGSHGYGGDWPTDHNDYTNAAISAGQSLRSEASVFTIGLFNYIQANQPANQTPHTTLWVATDTLTRAAQSGNFYNSPDASGLNEIYQKISTQINYYATNAVVTDNIFSAVMQGNFDFVDLDVTKGTASYENGMITWNIGTIGGSATLKYRVKAHQDYPGSGGNAIPFNGTATISYDDTNGNPGSSAFPIPTMIVPGPLAVDAGPDRTIGIGDSTVLGGSPTVSGGCPPYTISWTLNDNSISDDANPAVIPPSSKSDNSENFTYTVTVTDSSGTIRTDSVTVTVVKGRIIIVKVLKDAKGNIIRSSQGVMDSFPIHIQGPYGQWNCFAALNTQETFHGLRMGSYTISEPYIPSGYKLVSIDAPDITLDTSHNVKTVTVTNQIADESYFTDIDDCDNYLSTSSSFDAISVVNAKSHGNDIMYAFCGLPANYKNKFFQS